MRINKYIALATGMSRRAADVVITAGRATINGAPATAGSTVESTDRVTLDGKALVLPLQTVTIMLNKPVGYVVSRQGQGNRTIYDLLPAEYHQLKPVGRLDKDSSGLLILTNNGALAHRFTHPRYAKTKIYEVTLDKPLKPAHQRMISDAGIQLDDGRSRLQLEKRANAQEWRVSMHEGRNRQIRRTFAALGYTVTKLHRTHFGKYHLQDIKNGNWQNISKNEIL